MDENQISKNIVDCRYRIHRNPGSGLLESSGLSMAYRIVSFSLRSLRLCARLAGIIAALILQFILTPPELPALELKTEGGAPFGSFDTTLSTGAAKRHVGSHVDVLDAFINGDFHVAERLLNVRLGNQVLTRPSQFEGYTSR